MGMHRHDATPDPPTVRREADGRPANADNPADYPLAARCASCRRKIRIQSYLNAIWKHTAAPRPNRKLTMTGFDSTTPNVARMYDYFLGGKDNFAADREAAGEILRIAPQARQIAADNRAFLRRAVGYVAAGGIAQFIDIGSGLPTTENTHEIVAKAVRPSRTAYVDNDPVVVNHATALLANDLSVIAVKGDLRDPKAIFEDPALRNFIDLGQPAAVVLVAVLHFLNDAEAHAAVDYITSAIAPGSCLVLSHATHDEAHDDELQTLSGVYGQTPSPLCMRSGDEVQRFLDGLNPALPGLVDVNAWRNPGSQTAARTAFYGGVAFKP